MQEADPIPPYAREDSSSNAQGGSNRNCGHDGLIPCGQWTREEFAAACGAGETRHDVDCYQTLTEVFDGALCQKAGWKAVQARKTWHGQYAYRDPDRPQNYGLCPPPSTPSRTKYLTKQFDIEIHGTITTLSATDSGTDTFVTQYDVSIHQTWTIDQNTGILTTSGCVSTNTTVNTLNGELTTQQGGAVASQGIYFGSDWVNAVSSLNLDCLNAIVSAWDAGEGGLNPFPHNILVGGVIVPNTPDILAAAFADEFPNISRAVHHNPGATPPTWDGTAWTGGDPGYWADFPGGTYVYDWPGGGDEAETMTLTPNSIDTSDTSFEINLGYGGAYSATYDSPQPAKPFVTNASCSNTCHVKYEQSNPYTIDTVMGQVIDMLALVDLSDDKLIPWRGDGWTTVNPLLSYDEYPGAVTLPDSVGDCLAHVAGTDTSGHTGEILGRLITEGHPEMRLDAIPLTQDFTDYVGGETWTLTWKPNAIVSVDRYGRVEDVEGSPVGVRFHGVLGTDYTQDIAAGTVTEMGGNLLNTKTIFPDYVRITYTTQEKAGGHFDFRHVNPRWYQETDLTWHFDLAKYGAYSGGEHALDPTDTAQPWTATQWTGCTNGQNQDGKSFPHGAWIVADANGITMQKFAEIKLPWHSTNWFGPCGKDRDQKVATVGHTYECGGDPTGDGCSWTDNRLHRWPNAWPIECDRAAAFSETGGVVTVTMDRPALYLRDATANAFYGTGGGMGDKVDFTSADGLTVDSNGGSGYEVTELNDGTHGDSGAFSYFKFSGTTPDASMVRVKSHSAPHFKFYDTDGKGEFLAVSHTMNNRDIADGVDANYGTTSAIRYVQSQNGMSQNVAAYTVAQHCLPFIRCFPAVMCWSPNYDPEVSDIDTFDNGVTLAFPTSFTPDTRFANSWQGMFVQAVRDPWWLAPDGRCSPDLGETVCQPEGWFEDDGSGTSEDLPPLHSYYAHHPMVEARDSAAGWPTGFTPPVVQAMASGAIPVYTNYLTWGQLQSAGADGLVVLPCPVAGGPMTDYEVWDLPNEVLEETSGMALAPWRLWLRMQDCICRKDPATGISTPGRFADDYKKTIGCWGCNV